MLVVFENKIACYSSFYQGGVYIYINNNLMLHSRIYNIISVITAIIIVVVIIIPATGGGNCI